MHTDPVTFVLTADLGPEPLIPESATDGVTLDLDKLPKAVVSDNTLIDFSAARESVRGSLSLATAFAGRAAMAAMRDGDNEDDWFAAYKSNFIRLGFTVSQSAFTTSQFQKRGIAIHKAIIPFLTVALGGAGAGPVLLALLENLKEMDRDQPWITLFDQQSRKFHAREIHFGAVSSDAAMSSMRHVAARLSLIDNQTNVLFFKINDASADFKSATTTLSINNRQLANLEPALRDRLQASAFDFIKGASI